MSKRTGNTNTELYMQICNKTVPKLSPVNESPSIACTLLPSTVQWDHSCHSCLVLVDTGAEGNFIDSCLAAKVGAPYHSSPDSLDSSFTQWLLSCPHIPFDYSHKSYHSWQPPWGGCVVSAGVTQQIHRARAPLAGEAQLPHWVGCWKILFFPGASS